MAEAELETLISEYLDARGFARTRDAFQSERQERRRTPTPARGVGLQSDFLVAMDCGERAVFFELWDSHIPAELRASDPTCQNLEFSLSVFFATYPQRAGTGSCTQAMADFKAYLETRGAVLAQSAEFATYCALPYIPDPTRHPSFKTLFTDSWQAEVRTRLVHFLRHTLPHSNSPRLLALYLDAQHSTAGGQVSIQSLQYRLAETERQSACRMAELQSSYHTLVSISMELVAALESTVAGKMITPEYIHSMCMRLFGNSIPSSADFQRPSTGTSLLRASVMSLRQSATPITPSYSANSLTQLDYSKIKSDLRFSNDTRKALILQALRWRVTRSLPGAQRCEVVASLIDHDVLGCATSNEYQASVLQLLTSAPTLVLEHLCRLVNALSSLSAGRSYLAHCPGFIQGLCVTLIAEHWDSHTRKNALGAVQKLSLKRALQLLMIGAGVPQWVVGLLREVEGLSEYTMRYSLALLMNLCLRTAGKQACVPLGGVVVKTLGEMLEHEDHEICSYVNGILYSLLSVPEIRDEARAMGMSDLLTSALQASPPELQSQLKFIVKQLESDDQLDSTDSGDENDDDTSEDEEDPDLVEGDEEETAIGEDLPSGEALLTREYLLQTTSQRPQATRSHDIGSILSTPLKSSKVLDAPYDRPVTPQAFSRPHTTTLPVISSLQHDTANSEVVHRSTSATN